MIIQASAASESLAMVGTTVAVIATIGTFVLTMLNRRRRARAKLLQVGWEGASSPEATQASIYNESPVRFDNAVMTVSCSSVGREARLTVGYLEPKEGHRDWCAVDAHREMLEGGPGSESGMLDDLAHLTSPHDVHATFTDGKSYWSRTSRSDRVEKLKELTIWAEKTRAVTLKRYFGRRSRFHREFALRVNVKAFDRTEALEAEFMALSGIDHPADQKQLPDIVVGPHDWVGRVATDDLTKEPPQTEICRTVDPKALAALKRRVDRKTADVAGRRVELSDFPKRYGFPYVFDSVALIQNDALVTGPVPKNLSNVLAAGRAAITRHGIDAGIPLALQVGEPDAAGNAGDPYHMWPLFTSLGGSFFGLRDSATGDFDDLDEWREEFIEAFRRLADLGAAKGGPLDPRIGRGESLNLFLEGQAPYLISSSRALPAIKARHMQVTVEPIPGLGDQPPVPMVSVYGFFIYSKAPNLPAARDLLTTYMASPVAGDDLQKYQQLVPVQTEAMAAVAKNDAWLRAYVTQCRKGMIMPSYPNMRDAWRLLGQAEYDVLAGNGAPRDCAARVADEGWELLAQARDQW